MLVAERQRCEQLEKRLTCIYEQLSPRHPEGGIIEHMIGAECQRGDDAYKKGYKDGYSDGVTTK